MSDETITARPAKPPTFGGDSRVSALINLLRHFATEGEENRAALADLRRGLRRTPGELYPKPDAMARMAQHIAPILGDGWKPYLANGDRNRYDDGYWFFTVAALFASHTMHTDDKKSFGASYAAVAGEGSDSIKTRFTQLLNSRTYTLPDYLRQAVSLMDAQDEPVNYYRLLEDCLRWNAPGHPVQLKWARDFYTYQGSKKQETT